MKKNLATQRMFSSLSGIFALTSFFVFLFLPTDSIAQVQPPVGRVAIDAGKCKLLISERAARQRDERKQKELWTGNCVNGLANGFGVVRSYFSEKLQIISKLNYENGIPNLIEGYSLSSNNLIIAAKTLSDGKFSTVEVSQAEVPDWAGELVDGKARSEQVMLQSSAPKQTAADTANRDRVENKPGQVKKLGDSQSQTDAGKQKSNPLPPRTGADTSQASNSSSVDYRNIVGWIYSESAIFAAPYVVSDQCMLRGLVTQFRQLLAGNGAEANLKTLDCPAVPGAKPYIALAHFQVPSGVSSVGVNCNGGSSPEEAYVATCGNRGPGCTGSMSGREFAKYVIIVDRRIAVGKSTYAEPAVGVITQEATFKYRPGEKVSFSEKYNFSEGYVCHWGKDPYGNRFQMVTNGPFTSDFSTPRGRYEFNCGAKG